MKAVNACGIRPPPTEPTGETLSPKVAERAMPQLLALSLRLFALQKATSLVRGRQGCKAAGGAPEQPLVVIPPFDNPSVTASPCHLPLHKGGFWTANDLRLRKDYALGLEKCKAPSSEGALIFFIASAFLNHATIAWFSDTRKQLRKFIRSCFALPL